MSLTPDPRLAIFLSQKGPDVFHSVEHRHEIWKRDPYDVETLHAEARDIFQRLHGRAATPPGLPSGRILLILGESGSGKTHLLRAFRNHVHGAGQGFVGYMQMTTRTKDYPRYILGNLIDSLDRPYNEELLPMQSGLGRLSRAVATRCFGAGALARLKEEELDSESIHVLVRDAADSLLFRPDCADVDLDLVRVLLYLQREDPRLKARALKYLRCEAMSVNDAGVLGDVTPRTADDDPGRMVENLGRLMGRVFGQPLVLCVDQLEDVWSMDEATDRFLHVMTAVVAVADRVPSCVVVVCCLDDFYVQMSPKLTRSIRDRLEQDPSTLKLHAERSRDEIVEIVGKRLAHLYETQAIEGKGEDTHYPIPRSSLDILTNQRTRDVLDFCRRYREAAIREGELPGKDSGITPPVLPPKLDPVPPEALLALKQAWNDYRSGYNSPRPEEDVEIAALLAWAIARTGDELESGYRFRSTTGAGTIDVEVVPPTGEGARLRVAICNKDARGGGLQRQIEKVHKEAAGRLPVLVRSTEFPAKPNTKIAEMIGKLITAGGRRAVVEDAELITMLALRDFRKARGESEELSAWLARENPISQLPIMRTILSLDDVEPAGSTPESYQAATRSRPRAPVEIAPPRRSLSNNLLLGRTEGVSPHDISLAVDELTMHAAFLGGTGSGKTTLALGVVEQLLERNIPVILVDRKGDLVGYADEAAWEAPVRDPAQTERRRALRGKIDVAVYTPGNAAGRPLAVSLVPPGMKELGEADREDEAFQAADALAGMLDYKNIGRDKACRAVLTQAVLILSSIVDSLSLEILIDFIHGQDPALLSAIGKLDVRLFDKLVQDLETFKLTNSRLLEGDGETLDIGALFGLDGSTPRDKTRLSVISTKFLGDTGKTLFWIAQFLLRLTRWASHRPSPGLQAAVLFDEADLYLPAIGQPATKQPMENLLRRARSAGLGMLLATQSPGDFDYKCRDNIKTWVLGRITQSVAIQKMKPMLSECRMDVGSKLPGREVGHFFLVRGGEATGFGAGLPAILPEQRPDDEIASLAARTRRR